jgi:O-6-methylguanine DNA methyltransferase
MKIVERAGKSTRMVFHTLSFPSPLGWILIAAGSGMICLLHFCGSAQPSDDEILNLVREQFPGGALAEPAQDLPLLHQVKKAVLEYLNHGAPLPLPPLDTGKSTPFQREVWNALLQIPFGETRSYLEISRAVGRPGAARAVGRACGRNPIALLIPCHRVVASGGKLGGFSCGLDYKRALLKLERERVDSS